MTMNDLGNNEAEVITLYQQLILAWNDGHAKGMAECFVEEGELIGFDGSDLSGREEIKSHLHEIFSHHTPPPFVRKVRSVRFLQSGVVLLRAIVGMIPPDKTELEPTLNAHQTMTAVKQNDEWKIVLFQNTPAQFHGRPELVQQMTNELEELL